MSSFTDLHLCRQFCCFETHRSYFTFHRDSNESFIAFQYRLSVRRRPSKVSLIGNFICEVSCFESPYSPDFAPSDFHLFGPLKDALRGRSFVDDDELQYNVREDPRRFNKGFCGTGIQLLMQCWKIIC